MKPFKFNAYLMGILITMYAVVWCIVLQSDSKNGLIVKKWFIILSNCRIEKVNRRKIVML